MKIIFEFVGGFKDGQTCVGDTDHGPNFSPLEQDAFFAVGYYKMTKQGTIGARFQGLSDHTVALMQTAGHEAMKAAGVKPQLHKYEVYERLDGENEVVVRAKYVQTDSPPAQSIEESRS